MITYCQVIRGLD